MLVTGGNDGIGLETSIGLARRFDDIDVFAVHPGVAASNLGGDMGGFVRWLKGALLISTEAGAQTSLFTKSKLFIT